MIHREMFIVTPDVERVLLDAYGTTGWRRRVWSYTQGYAGVVLDDAVLVYFDAAALGQGHRRDTAEMIWCARFPRDIYQQPTWHYCVGEGPDDHECYRPRVIRTPDTWPAERRWLMTYTGTQWSRMGQPYRQHMALAWAADPLGPWAWRQDAIPARKQWPPVPGKPGIPAGIWATSVIVWHGRVLVIGRDASVPPPHHLIYEVQPDLTVTVEPIGVVVVSPPAAWLSDMRLTDGGMYALTSAQDAEHVAGSEIVEAYADLPPGDTWPAALTLRAGIRRFAHPDAALASFDAGYIRAADGGASWIDGVIANAGFPSGATKGPDQVGGWCGQVWSSAPRGVLERSPVPLPVAADVP